MYQLSLNIQSLRVMAPFASERASLKENHRPYPRAVMYRKFLYICNNSVRRISLKFHILFLLAFLNYPLNNGILLQFCKLCKEYRHPAKPHSEIRIAFRMLLGIL